MTFYGNENDYENIDVDMSYEEEIVALQERLEDFNKIARRYTTLCSDDGSIWKSCLLIIMLLYRTFKQCSY